MKKITVRRGQSMMEYLIIFVVFALAIVSSNFLGRAKEVCESHFQSVRSQILN